MMRRTLIAAASAGIIGFSAVSMPNKAEAHWGGGWWVPGAVIGFALGAVLSHPYYHHYYYGYHPHYYYPRYYGYYSYRYYHHPYWHRHYYWRHHHHWHYYPWHYYHRSHY